MSFIQGHCRTNLDDAKRWTWPTLFVAVPRIGERIRARERGVGTDLKVCSVTHYEAKRRLSCEDGGECWEPRIEVELNK